MTRVAVTVEQSWHRVPGGTATSTVRTLQALVRTHPEVQVVGVAALHRGPAAPGVAPPVPVRHLPLPRHALYPSWQWARWPRVEAATGPVDVVHATTFAVPPAAAPLVVTVHDLAFLHDPHHYTTRGNRFFRRGLDLTVREAELVLVPSRQTAEDCVAHGVDADRIRLVPWGVAPATGTPPEVVASARLRYHLPRRYVLWTGTLEPRKNLSTLLAAFAQVARHGDLHLVLVGPLGWGDAVGDGPRPPADRVHALGFVPDADLQALYAGAEAFCYPSTREGFGMPVLEAMAHGLPVVTSEGTPMADLIDGDGDTTAGPAGLAVPATSPDALAAALLEVTGDRHDELAEAASARAASRPWSLTAALTAEAYGSVADRR